MYVIVNSHVRAYVCILQPAGDNLRVFLRSSPYPSPSQNLPVTNSSKSRFQREGHHPIHHITLELNWNKQTQTLHIIGLMKDNFFSFGHKFYVIQGFNLWPASLWFSIFKEIKLDLQSIGSSSDLHR